MRLLVILVLALLPSIARADGETQSWSALFVQYRPVAGGIAGWLDLQPRRGTTTILIARPGIGWGFGEHLTVHAGYGNIQTFVDEGDDKMEHRFWQQALYVRTLSDEVKIQGRFRVEQRLVDGDDSTGHRVRAMGYVRYAPRPGLPQLVIIDEMFVQLNDTAALRSGFNQNRLFVGFGADAKVKGVRFELGYMNIKFGAANNKNMDHAVSANLIAVIQ
jgi:hypothetical protein